jgi:hypothetical protein
VTKNCLPKSNLLIQKLKSWDKKQMKLNNLGGDLDRIATQIEGGLTVDEADSVATEVRSLAARTKALADRNPEPTPPVEPTEPTPPTE